MASLWYSSGSSRSSSSSAQSSSAWIFSQTLCAISLYMHFLDRQRKQKETQNQKRAPTELLHAASLAPALTGWRRAHKSVRGIAGAKSCRDVRHSAIKVSQGFMK